MNVSTSLPAPQARYLQCVAVDRLADVLLSLRGGPALYRTCLASEVLLLLGDLVKDIRVDDAATAASHVRWTGAGRVACWVACGAVCAAGSPSKGRLGKSRWATGYGLVGLGDDLLACGDVVDDGASESLAHVLLGHGGGTTLHWLVLVGELLLGSGDLRDEVGVDGDGHGCRRLEGACRGECREAVSCPGGVLGEAGCEETLVEKNLGGHGVRLQNIYCWARRT
jgi:hypothetical protein